MLELQVSSLSFALFFDKIPLISVVFLQAFLKAI